MWKWLNQKKLVSLTDSSSIKFWVSSLCTSLLPTYWGINSYWYNKNTSQHIHDCYRKEEKVMCSVEMLAFLDDHAEEEVAKETNEDDDQVQDDIAPTEKEF